MYKRQILDWAPDTGASSFNGSSFHVRITEFDGGSVGNRDNQMSADAVRPNGTITIVKDAVPNDTQNFKFTLQNTTTGASQNFTLDDDSGATLSLIHI